MLSAIRRKQWLESPVTRFLAISDVELPPEPVLVLVRELATSLVTVLVIILVISLDTHRGT